MYRETIKHTEQYVKDYLEDVESGHNWWHIYRVRNIAMHIFSIEERGDAFIIEMSSLLHDIGDYKIEPDNDTDHLRVFLDGLRLEEAQKDKIAYIIGHISFRDSFGPEYERMPELDIVQDADRLDAIGAIGIARAFNYGGSRGLEIYNPYQGPREYKTPGEYKGSDSSTINHFYEKLLKLKDSMNTNTAKELAEDRHKYLEVFLEQFFMEWNTGISLTSGQDL